MNIARAFRIRGKNLIVNSSATQQTICQNISYHREMSVVSFPVSLYLMFPVLLALKIILTSLVKAWCSFILSTLYFLSVHCDTDMLILLFDAIVSWWLLTILVLLFICLCIYFLSVFQNIFGHICILCQSKVYWYKLP